MPNPDHVDHLPIQLDTRNNRVFSPPGIGFCSTVHFQVRIGLLRLGNVRTVVPFNAITLDGGMSEIDLLAKLWRPGGTLLEWEIKPQGQIQGQTQWVTMQEYEDRASHPLVGLPPLVELRLAMVGTPHLAPMIVLDSVASALCGRNRGDMVAISQDFDFGVSSTSLVMEVNVDGWIPAEHTFTPKVVVGVSDYGADTVTEYVDDNTGERRRFVATFTVPATSSARMKIEMTASNVVEVPFGEDAFLAAL